MSQCNRVGPDTAPRRPARAPAVCAVDPAYRLADGASLRESSVHRTHVIGVNFVERITRRALLFAELSNGVGHCWTTVDEAIRKYQAEYPEACASVTVCTLG